MNPLVRSLEHAPIRSQFGPIHTSDVMVLSADPRVSEWKARSEFGIRGYSFDFQGWIFTGTSDNCMTYASLTFLLFTFRLRFRSTPPPSVVWVKSSSGFRRDVVSREMKQTV